MEVYGEKARHAHVIWLLLEEAVELIDRTPDQDKRWLSSGYRSGGWNMVGMSVTDVIEIERLRILSAMHPGDTSSPMAQMDDHVRMMDVLDWMRFLNEAKDYDLLRKAALTLIRTGKADDLIKTMDRSSTAKAVRSVKQRCTGMIMTGLKKNGIEREGQCRFMAIEERV